MPYAQTPQRRGLRVPRLATRWLGRATALVTVDGEVDAANAEALRSNLIAAVRDAGALVVDLSRVEFFGVEGFWILSQLSQSCRHRHVQLKLVPGPAVCRVLRVADPLGALPTAVSADAALAGLHGKGLFALRSG
jgi:anti-anti-sigma factor